MSAFTESVARLKMSRAHADRHTFSKETALALRDRLNRAGDDLAGVVVYLGQKVDGSPDAWIDSTLADEANRAKEDCEPLNISRPCGDPPLPPCP